MQQFLTPKAVEAAKEIALAPVNHVEILPSVLPVVLGAVVIELYFGKHGSEDLGWNSSVSNAIIWVATGASLYLTQDLGAGLERTAVLLLLGFGIAVGFLDFFHIWPKEVAFIASAPTVVYVFAYMTTVLVRTPLEIGTETLKGAGIFAAAAFTGFEVLKLSLTSQDDGLEFD